MKQPISQTDFPGLTLLKRGKVRDMYDLGEHFLMVATDRISAFDVIMDDPIPDKGIILTQISLFWFEAMRPIVANHVVEQPRRGLPGQLPPLRRSAARPQHAGQEGDAPADRVRRARVHLRVRLELVPGERRALRHRAAARSHGSDRLPEAIFTPATKEEVGTHDINIDFAEACRRVGPETAGRVRDLTLAIYRKGAGPGRGQRHHHRRHQVRIRVRRRRLILIDEVLTPDSSGSGRKSPTHRAGRSRATTSSTCATTSCPSAGARPRPAAPARRGGAQHPAEIPRSAQAIERQHAWPVATGLHWDSTSSPWRTSARGMIVFASPRPVTGAS